MKTTPDLATLIRALVLKLGGAAVVTPEEILRAERGYVVTSEIKDGALNLRTVCVDLLGDAPK